PTYDTPREVAGLEGMPTRSEAATVAQLETTTRTMSETSTGWLGLRGDAVHPPDTLRTATRRTRHRCPAGCSNETCVDDCGEKRSGRCGIVGFPGGAPTPRDRQAIDAVA